MCVSLNKKVKHWLSEKYKNNYRFGFDCFYTFDDFVCIMNDNIIMEINFLSALYIT